MGVVVALLLGGLWFYSQGMFVGDDNAAAVVRTDSTVVAITASPMLVPSGGVSNIIWGSTGFASCKMQGPGVEGSGRKGNRVTGAITGASTYTVTCTTKEGSTASQSVTVGVNKAATK